MSPLARNRGLGRYRCDTLAPRWLAAVALLVTLACKREAPASSPPAPIPSKPAAPAAASSAGAPATTAAAAKDASAAAAWLDALRERDPGALAAKSLLPFDFRDTHARGKCGTRAAATRAAATTVTTCLATDPRLHAELSATPEPRLVPLDVGSFPPWAQGWAKTMRPGLRGLSTFVHGEADARELVLLVGDDGVHGIWQNLSVEPK
jgi:hypothetical protein